MTNSKYDNDNVRSTAPSLSFALMSVLVIAAIGGVIAVAISWLT